MTPDEFLDGSPLGRDVLAAVHRALAGLRNVRVRTTKSQISFRRRRGFAYLWLPGRYLRSPGAEVVLTITLPEERTSPRWKEIAHPAPRTWQHHLEISDVDEVDAEVERWLREAYDGAA